MLSIGDPCGVRWVVAVPVAIDRRPLRGPVPRRDRDRLLAPKVAGRKLGRPENGRPYEGRKMSKVQMALRGEWRWSAGELVGVGARR